MSESKHTIYGSLTALDREDVTRVLWTRTGEWMQASEVEREIEHLRKQLLEVERLLQRGEIFQALAIIQRVTGTKESDK
jgi:hypothetical protein